MKKDTTISILGAGWLGEPLAKELQVEGYAVKTATTRQDKAERLSQSGFDSYVFRVEEERINGRYDRFFEANTLILTLPPGGRRNPEVAKQYPAKIQQVIAASKAAGVQHVLFTSSTGVYGDQEGWVDETSPLVPNTASGTALVQVETDLRAAYGKQVTILRLAGLVGGSRQPGRWFTGREGVAGGEQFVNLVHRTDVISLCQAIVEQGYWGHILNVCADEHPTKAAYYITASTQLGLNAPSFLIDQNAQGGKRVDNKRSKTVPGFSYRFPDPFEFEG